MSAAKKAATHPSARRARRTASPYLLLGWILITSVVAAGLAKTDPVSAIAGLSILVAVICLIVGFIVTVARGRSGRPAPSKRPNPIHKLGPTDELRERNPALAARCDRAMELLLAVGPDLDSATGGQTRASLLRRISDADRLFEAEQQETASLDTLRAALQASGQDPEADRQYRQAADAVAGHAARRTKVEAELDRSSRELTEALRGAADARAARISSHEHRVALSSARESVDKAVAGDDGADDLPDTHAAELADQVDGVRARLEAVKEVDRISDTFAPDADDPSGDRK